MKPNHQRLPLIGLLNLCLIGIAQATAISSSQISLDLTTFSISPAADVSITAFVSGGNANAQSQPYASSNPQINVGPFDDTGIWPSLDFGNAVVNATGSGTSNGVSTFIEAQATADGTNSSQASASVFVHHNTDFTLASDTDMTFSVDYLITQALQRDTANESASAYSQVTLQLSRSGFRNGQYFYEVLNDTFYRLSDRLSGAILVGASGDISDTLVLTYSGLSASESDQHYTIEAQAYTQAYADTPDFTAVPSPAIFPLLSIGLLALGWQPRGVFA